MLDLSAQALRHKDVFVTEADRRVNGWAGLRTNDGTDGRVCLLEDLWIEPVWMGRGLGSCLFRHAATHAAQLGVRRMEGEAEPNAIGFYEKMGGRYLRQTEPNRWGRILPVMGIELSKY